MLSVPSTPAQGATAPTAVEKAERRVDALQQEKAALQKKISLLENKISLLEKYCSRRITTDSGRAEVAKELWVDFEIDVKDVAEVKAKLENLKKDLTSVNTLYEKTVSSYADLVAMQRAVQVPQVCYVCVCVADVALFALTTQGNVTQVEIGTMEKIVATLKLKNPTECAELPDELHDGRILCIYPRKCYRDGLDYVMKKRGEETGRFKHKIFRFGGTPGIGKTTFRYWILWLWVRGETNGLQQKHCLFSIGTSKLVLLTREHKNITVRGAGDPCDVYPTSAPWSGDCVGVVEMSTPQTGIHLIPEGECPCVSLLMIVGSPGKFFKGVSCFKAVVIASPYYFPTWDANEAAKLPVAHFAPDPSETVDEATIRRRCEEYGGVLRLMRGRSADAETQLNDALKVVNEATINAVLNKTCGDETVRVHRLLRLDAQGEVVDFVSHHVARKAMRVMDDKAHDEMTQVMKSAACNPKYKAFWGYFFEERFGQGFGGGNMALHYKTEAEENRLEPSGSLQHYEAKRCQQTLKKDVLYQPPACFQGIDFFMLGNETVSYLQTTVSSTHTEVDPDHADHTGLDEVLKKYYTSEIKKRIIYVLPDVSSAHKFTAPRIPHGWMCIVAWPMPGVFAPRVLVPKRRAGAKSTAPPAKRTRK